MTHDLARALREDPVATLARVEREELVLVEPTAAARCHRTREQLGRLARGQPLRRSREGVRGARPAPPIPRAALRALRILATDIVRGRADSRQIAELIALVERHRLVLMRKADFDQCERDRLELKRVLRRRIERGQRVESERARPGTALLRGVERCVDCTSVPMEGRRRCEACLRRERARQRASYRAEHPLQAWRWDPPGRSGQLSAFSYQPEKKLKTDRCRDPPSMMAIRRLLYRATRDRAARTVLLDALLERFPGLVEPKLAEADQRARQHRTAFVLLVHPNMVLSRTRQGRPTEVFESDFIVWPAGYVDRRKVERRFHFVEIFRTRYYTRKGRL